jgi:hypothetical protein
LVDTNFNLTRHLVGVDFGQAQDYTALAVIKQLKHKEDSTLLYEVVALERPPLETQYNKIVDYVIEVLKNPVLSGKINGTRLSSPPYETELVVDATGCGRPVVDMLRERRVRDYAHLVACNITGGQTLTCGNDGFYGVPKRDLATKLQVLFQEKRLKIAETLPLGPILTQELLNFRVKINPKTGNDSYEAWREKDHDDMVLAVALAIWWADTYRK